MSNILKLFGVIGLIVGAAAFSSIRSDIQIGVAVSGIGLGLVLVGLGAILDKQAALAKQLKLLTASEKPNKAD